MITFTPLYKSTIWGGRRLESMFGRNVPNENIGESWELGELLGFNSEVASGCHKGNNLGDLWRNGDLGGSAQGDFPFLLKWIDSQQNLSVQVHPDAVTCKNLCDGNPKTEAWYVLYAEPEAKLIIGHYPGLNNTKLRDGISNGTLHEWLREIHPHAGDIFLIPAGTIHSIGAGIILLEVQQPSDTTYRIYDWNRVHNKRRRTLHLEAACQSIRYDSCEAPEVLLKEVNGPGFSLQKIPTGTNLSGCGLRIIVADSRSQLETEFGEKIEMKLGDVIVAEPGDGKILVTFGSAILITEP